LLNGRKNFLNSRLYEDKRNNIGKYLKFFNKEKKYNREMEKIFKALPDVELKIKL